jgi:hypothetical protein
MDEIGQFIVSLWCFPVIVFVFLPLFVGCLWVIYSKFNAFRPAERQETKPVESSLSKEKTV